MKKPFVYSLLALVGLVVVGALAFAIFQPIQVLPRIRLAPGFILTDQNGERLTNEDLRGSIVLYAFTYTGCETPCQSTTPVLQDLQPQIAAMDTGGIKIQFVTISVDPDRDTPEVLQAYAADAGANPATWHFATTSDATMLKDIVGGGFEVFYEAKPGEAIQLDPVFMLVDGWGILRGEYRYASSTPDEDRLLRHIQVLLNEIKNSKGAAKLAYEAAHLFVCYAP